MIVLNERLWAEDILNTGELGSNQWYAVNVLVRYFYHVQGLKKKAIVFKMNELLSQLMPDYGPLAWESIIEKTVDKAKKHPLIEVENIPVTKGEMKAINKLNHTRLKRLGFTMVVVAKYFNARRSTNNNWVNLELKEVFDLACVHTTIEDQAQMYRELIDARFIEYSKKVGNNNARVLVIDDSEPEMFVSDLRAIGHAYQLYCGEPYFKCERCGILVRQNKPRNRKYCNECAKAPTMSMRKFECIDCGKEVFVVARNARSCRCTDCQAEARIQKYQRYHEKCRQELATDDRKD